MVNEIQFVEKILQLELISQYESTSKPLRSITQNIRKFSKIMYQYVKFV